MKGNFKGYFFELGMVSHASLHPNLADLPKVFQSDMRCTGSLKQFKMKV